MKFDFYFAVSKTMDNLRTVLRNIRSATACLPNSERIPKEKFPSAEVFTLSKYRSVTVNR
jgi:hypothetical protein